MQLGGMWVCQRHMACPTQLPHEAGSPQNASPCLSAAELQRCWGESPLIAVQVLACIWLTLPLPPSLVEACLSRLMPPGVQAVAGLVQMSVRHVAQSHAMVLSGPHSPSR